MKDELYNAILIENRLGKQLQIWICHNQCIFQLIDIVYFAIWYHFLLLIMIQIVDTGGLSLGNILA